MLARYVLLDLVRNPRRTLSTVVGVCLGVGLFSGVLFFVDGLSASMTQRAVAPLAIDMQRVVTDRVGGTVALSQTFDPPGVLATGTQATVVLELRNDGDVAANEVIVRSLLGTGLGYVDGSAEINGAPIEGVPGNPFSQDPGQTGYNLGTVPPGASMSIRYRVEADAALTLDETNIVTSYSTREAVNPVAANRPATVPLDLLATSISGVDGVASASPLSLADLGSNTLSTRTGGARRTAAGAAKVFGFDESYAEGDDTILIADGSLSDDGAVLSAEAAAVLDIGVGDRVTVTLPDGNDLEIDISGVADLSRSRSLFSSRRGGDLETLIYTPYSVIVSPPVFAETVFPAYERAAAERNGRLKSPPVREVDISLDRERLAADPATALGETQQIAAAVNDVATDQDYLLDNISNALGVAADDAGVAKRLFVFLGVPGGFLAAMLAAYSGSVLADAQRREQAILRIRGANRRHLLRMLAIRTSLLTLTGAAIGSVAGYVATAVILGHDSLSRASTAGLVRSGLIGAAGGLLSTGLALYVTGRRSIDREINEDRARLELRAPLWRRARLDLVGLGVVAVGTAIALQSHAFEGASGSVYFGRAVELKLALLVLPLAVWLTGSLLAARGVGALLSRSATASSSELGRPLPSLYRLSVSRRPWAIGNGAIVIASIVALAVCLGVFTSSYDTAKAADARYANGSDIRITPSPTAEHAYTIDDRSLFLTDGVREATPVIYGVSNVILRSARTSDPANLAAIDPVGFAKVAPVVDAEFPLGDARAAFGLLDDDRSAVLLSQDMASFLKAGVGDTLHALLARATADQVDLELHIVGIYERLPGFPDGADAVMSIVTHTAAVPAKSPDFFLAATTDRDGATLDKAVQSLQSGPGSAGDLQIDSRATTLDRDQSSLAALNIAGLVDLDSSFALGMTAVAIAVFVFGLLLQRRREYVTLRAQGLEPSTIRMLVAAEAATVSTLGSVAGLVVGATMGFYFVTVLRPLFVLPPAYSLPLSALATPVLLVLAATVITSTIGSRLINGMAPTELLRDE